MYGGVHCRNEQEIIGKMKVARSLRAEGLRKEKTQVDGRGRINVKGEYRKNLWRPTIAPLQTIARGMAYVHGAQQKTGRELGVKY